MAGLDGKEGAFIMVTFWLVEAMGRVSTLPPPLYAQELVAKRTGIDGKEAYPRIPTSERTAQ